MRNPVISERKSKWGTGDSFALEAMRSLAGAFVPWTSFSLRPSALLTALNEIVFYRPPLTIECGGGASTIYMARLLQQQGAGGRLITVESDLRWATYLRDFLQREGLEAIAQVVHSPIVPWVLSDVVSHGDGDGEMLPDKWYDVDTIKIALGGRHASLLVVDGPPGSKKLSRYPAVPELLGHLTSDAVIMLDDAHRDQEAETVRRWSVVLQAEFTIYRRMSLAICRRGGGFTLLGC